MHVQCAWRLLDNARIVVGPHERWIPRGDPHDIPDDFDCNVPHATLCDEKLEDLIRIRASDPLVVTAVAVGDGGAFTVRFTSGHALDVFPDGSTDEQWRFIDNQPEPPEHFVFTMDLEHADRSGVRPA